MSNAVTLPYSTTLDTFGTTLSSPYQWYVQWYQYPTITDTMSSQAKITLNSIQKTNKRSLPSGYTQLKYIESTGTQYIDTGHKPNQDTRVVAKYQMTNGNDSVWYRLWGSSNGSYTNDFSAWTYGTTKVQHYYGCENIVDTSVNGGVVEIDANKNAWNYNGISKTYSSQTFSCEYSMYIFNINNDTNSAYVPAKMKLYSFKLYDNGTLIRDFVPCKDASGVIGLYDLVNNQMYQNSGAGTFAYGEISQSSVQASFTIFSKNAITRTGTNGYTCEAFTFSSQPTIKVNNTALNESIEIYNVKLSTSVADNGTGTVVSSAIVHSATVEVEIPKTWLASANTTWNFSISDVLTIVNTSVTATNTHTFASFVVPPLFNIWVKMPLRLSDEYTQVEYIESTGTQYIDTGFQPNQDTRVDIIAMPLSVAEANAGQGFIPYGAGHSYNDTAFECYTSQNKFEFNYASTYQYIGTPVTNEKVIISQNKNNVAIEQCGTVNTLSFTYQTFTAPYTMTLFAINRGAALCGLQKIYSCQIYDNGTLIRDFVPCVNSSSVAGLYDLVNGVFYANAGTGVFAVGNAVASTSVLKQVKQVFTKRDGILYEVSGLNVRVGDTIV